MKRIIFILSIFMITISCNSLSTSEKSIQEYMRTQTGSPDLEIEFTNVQITKQTVGDSIDILQKIFEEQIKEKEKTIKRIENDNQAKRAGIYVQKRPKLCISGSDDEFQSKTNQRVAGESDQEWDRVL